MVSYDYSIAFSETLEILDHTRKEDVQKIPNKFLEFLKLNSLKNYESKLDFSKNLSDMNLSPKTIGILSLIHKKYWCNNEQRKDFEEKLKQNEIIYQKKLSEKYNNKTLFEEKVETVEKAEKHDLIIVENKKWYKKIFEKIFCFFSKK